MTDILTVTFCAVPRTNEKKAKHFHLIGFLMYNQTDFLNEEDIGEYSLQLASSITLATKDKENLNPTRSAGSVPVKKRKRDSSQHSSTLTTCSSWTQTYDDERDMEAMETDFAGFPVVEHESKRFRRESDNIDFSPISVTSSTIERVVADVIRNLPDDAIDTEDPIPQHIICPVYNGKKPKQLSFTSNHSSTPYPLKVHHVTSNNNEGPRPDISGYDSSITDSTATSSFSTKTVATEETASNGSPSKMRGDSGISLSPLPPITETPKTKKRPRKQSLAVKFEETSNAHEFSSDDDDDDAAAQSSVANPAKRGRGRQKTRVNTAAAAEASTSAATTVKTDAQRSTVKRQRIAHICPKCNAEVATATILRYHIRKCIDESPEKASGRRTNRSRKD